MIRLMEIDDHEEVFGLWARTENIGLRSLDDSKEGIGRFLKRNPGTSFVAVKDQEIIGAILCGNDGRRGYIYHTVVKKEYRNRGVATRLIDHAVEALKKEGITRVCLNVMETNEDGKRFWEARGWERKDFLGFYSRSITEEENRPLFSLH